MFASTLPAGRRIGVKEGTATLPGIAEGNDPANCCGSGGGPGTHGSAPAASATAAPDGGCFCPSGGRGGRAGGGTAAASAGAASAAGRRWSLGLLRATTSTVAQLIFPAALCFIPWCAHSAILVRFVLSHCGHLYRVILSLRASPVGKSSKDANVDEREREEEARERQKCRGGELKLDMCRGGR